MAYYETDPSIEENPMFETTKQKAVATKNFVKKHRVAIAVTATSIAWGSLMLRNTREIDTFLKAHDLYEEYYAQEEAPIAE